MTPFDFGRGGDRGDYCDDPKSDRSLSVIQQVVNRQLRQREAAVQLGLSIRQVKRLVVRFRQEGPPGLVSRHLGRRPGNALSKAVRQEIMGLVHERYADFGPTLACEKLVEQHGYRLSVETLRQWMIAEGLWKPKKRKAARIHQRRPAGPARENGCRSMARWSGC